ncbi:MFS transporter [Microbacterium sp. P01]|uniref:MFS transporter n=1 Tax=unclassified Microbacterium TaxID=2609290 RepID=UPI0036708005
MSTPDQSPIVPAAETARGVGELLEGSETGAPALPKAKARWITALVVGVFGAYIAFVTPIAISLALRVDNLAPDNSEYLGIILSVGALASLLFGPLAGQLSDRTKTRIGRRRPWIIGGIVVGFIALAIMGLAPNILVLGIGWVLAQLGWSQVLNNLTTLMADKLPESQRGKVSGLTGAMTGLAPVFGAVIGGMVSANPVALMLVPATIGVVLLIPILIGAHEIDSRSLAGEEPMTLRTTLANFVFNPKRYPDFGWNWLGRAIFFFGLTLSTTYTAFFYADRLGIAVDETPAVVATVGGIGILGVVVGALLSGFLSDRLRRRKPFILVAGILFAAGSVVMISAGSVAILVVGTLITNLAIGVFGAVDQALMLDTLPAKETDAARFVNIFAYATTLPQALAPAAASLLLLVGATGDSKNYVILYIAAAVLTIVGGILILRIKSVR